MNKSLAWIMLGISLLGAPIVQATTKGGESSGKDLLNLPEGERDFYIMGAYDAYILSAQLVGKGPGCSAPNGTTARTAVAMIRDHIAAEPKFADMNTAGSVLVASCDLWGKGAAH